MRFDEWYSRRYGDQHAQHFEAIFKSQTKAAWEAGRFAALGVHLNTDGTFEFTATVMRKKVQVKAWIVEPRTWGGSFIAAADPEWMVMDREGREIMMMTELGPTNHSNLIRVAGLRVLREGAEIVFCGVGSPPELIRSSED